MSEKEIRKAPEAHTLSDGRDGRHEAAAKIAVDAYTNNGKNVSDGRGVTNNTGGDHVPPAKIHPDHIHFGGQNPELSSGFAAKAQMADAGQKKQQEGTPEAAPKQDPKESQPPEKNWFQKWADNASQELQHEMEGLTNWIPRN